MTHGFVVEFASRADRDYYVNYDEAHQAFKDWMQEGEGKIDDVTVVDYEVGIY